MEEQDQIAVANGGEYIEPRVVRAIDHDNRRYVVQPSIVRRAITADTAASLTTIMEGVVERGTATPARMDHYTIAGKTGTAAKLSNGHYSASDYNASFVGFVPSRDPAVAIIVVTDSPHGTAGHTGGHVSAPVFKRIADATLRYLGVAPTIDPDNPILVAREAVDAGAADGPDSVLNNGVARRSLSCRSDRDKRGVDKPIAEVNAPTVIPFTRVRHVPHGALGKLV